jgi:hypothetical protein
MKRKHRKALNKTELLYRLSDALQSLYHNATPNHPRNIPDELWQEYDAQFYQWAEDEIHFMRGGGCTGKTPYNEMKHIKEKYMHLKSWPVIARIKRAQFEREKEKWFSILDHGKLYTWGRGGRTLAPDGLINSRGASFSIKDAGEFAHYSREAIVDLIKAIDAFNEYVINWCSSENLSYMWADYCDNKKDDLKSEAIEARKELKTLLVAIKQSSRDFAAPICNVLTDRAQALRAQHRELVQSIVLYNHAVKVGA